MEKLRYLFENYNLAEMLVKNWNYDEDSVKNFRNFRISSNAIYPFEINGKAHFLRVSPDDSKTVVCIEEEIAFTKYLRAQNYNAVNFIASRNGRMIESCETPWGRYNASVMVGVSGLNLEDLDLDESIAFEFGCTLGKLHKLSSTYGIIPSNRVHCSEALSWCKSYLSDFPEQREIIEAIKYLEPILEALPKEITQYGLIHYDFDLDNVFMDQESGQMHVIDFDDCMMSWYEMDVVLSLDKLGMTYKDSFLKGYNSHYHLSSEFERLAPIFRQFTLIYSYTRIVRSIEEKWENEPTWMSNLRVKLETYLVKTKEEIIKIYNNEADRLKINESNELYKYLCGRADQFQYKQYNGDNKDVLFQIAKWHNLTPKLWLSDYKVSEKDVLETINRINDTPKEDLFIEYASDSNDILVGFIWAYRMGDHNKVMIMSIFVHEEHRNKGVAKTLKEKLEVWCVNRGVDEIHTTVHYENTKMIKLNQKLGYESGMVNMVKRLDS